jgi:hypothetical protein
VTSRLPSVRIGAVVAIGIAAGLAIWLGTRDEGSHSAGATAKVFQAGAGGLRRLVAALHRPVYWAGEQPGKTYQLTEATGGNVYLKYVPQRATPGAVAAALTVGTYAVPDAFAVTEQQASRAGSVAVPATGGAIAFYGKNAPTSVYLAFPGHNVQIEVYDPTGHAASLVTSGKIVPVG